MGLSQPLLVLVQLSHPEGFGGLIFTSPRAVEAVTAPKKGNRPEGVVSEHFSILLPLLVVKVDDCDRNYPITEEGVERT